MLFGSHPDEKLVAVEAGEGAKAKLFVRSSDGKTEECEAEFSPFLWLAGPVGLDGLTVEPLSGGLFFNHLGKCATWADFRQVTRNLREQRVPFFAFTDPGQQFLAATGRTLFKGMVFPDLRRIQLNIQTFCAEGFDFSNAGRETDHVLAIAMSDATGWEHLIIVDAEEPKKSETAALRELTAIIADRDPDVIEGHNLLNYDLPYLEARAKLRRVSLKWGRDGSKLRGRKSRAQIAERTIDYTRFEVYGRHVVDTFFLAQFYDIAARDLEGLGLKTVARHFGLAGGDGEDDDVVESGSPEIQRAYFEDRPAFESIALQAVREVRALSGLLSSSYFAQAQMLPFSYQNIVLRGNAMKIDALFLREYLRQGHSIPATPDRTEFAGGYTDIFFTGVARPIWHCDVTSLYPSIMLAFEVFPQTDALGVFGGLLADLRRFRIEAKQRMQALDANGPDRQAYQAVAAVQNTFKILINSFYGYLGFNQAHFGDFEAAAEVTRRGREILMSMVDWLRSQNAEPVEIDTDGIYFVPPAGTQVEELASGIRSILHEGIEVEFDTGYEAMFSYKAKNYALLKHDGRVILRGAALRSRGLEKFQRVFLQRMVRHLLEGQPDRIGTLRDEIAARLKNQDCGVEFFAKSESLTISKAEYERKIAGSSRGRAAIYEIALRSERDFRPGDTIAYYITGDKKTVPAHSHAKPVADWDSEARDENTAYYLGKLDALFKKFEAFLKA